MEKESASLKIHEKSISLEISHRIYASAALPWEAKEAPAVSPLQPGGPVSPCSGLWMALSSVTYQVILILFKYPHLLNGAWQYNTVLVMMKMRLIYIKSIAHIFSMN